MRTTPSSCLLAQSADPSRCSFAQLVPGVVFGSDVLGMALAAANTALAHRMNIAILELLRTEARTRAVTRAAPLRMRVYANGVRAWERRVLASNGELAIRSRQNWRRSHPLRTQTALRTRPSVCQSTPSANTQQTALLSCSQEYRQLERLFFGPVADMTCANAVAASNAIDLNQVGLGLPCAVEYVPTPCACASDCARVRVK